MPVYTEPAPTTAPKEKFVLPEDASQGVIDPTTWDAVALQASRDAQAALHTKGLSYFIGRGDDVIEVLPGGEEKIVFREDEA